MANNIRAVINLRGSMVTVVDLSLRFGRQATQTCRRSCIIMLDVTQVLSLEEISQIDHVKTAGRLSKLEAEAT
jgi:chemotaxis signal transduction protein